MHGTQQAELGQSARDLRGPDQCSIATVTVTVTVTVTATASVVPAACVRRGRCAAIAVPMKQVAAKPAIRVMPVMALREQALLGPA
jgi:hypothetical protein